MLNALNVATKIYIAKRREFVQCPDLQTFGGFLEGYEVLQEAVANLIFAPKFICNGSFRVLRKALDTFVATTRWMY